MSGYIKVRAMRCRITPKLLKIRDTNDKNTMYVSYPLLRKPTREELEEVYDY